MKDERTWCCYHPGEFVIGVCALCLNERLLILVSKQGADHRHHQTLKRFSAEPKVFSAAKIARIFARASLLNLVEIGKRKPDQCCRSSSASREDSFISIKFEDNGVASWDTGSKMPRMPLDLQRKILSNANGNEAKKVKSVVEHTKPQVARRWRRRIGHIFQLIRLKKPTKGNVCHVSTKPGRSKG